MDEQSSQLNLFGNAAGNPKSIAYAVRDEIGGAIESFIQFCRERLNAQEGEISLSLIIEEAWKKGRNHPYLKAFDAYQESRT
ncbi:hypothetical protein [Alcaligenes faecalis]|uniref:Uncharacterized protein n=1 Tax=Alcaligenes faecalis TaxID=511 RepID=A0ABY7NCR4_ALCFA|nr:hypothetical protein [Alcaligenes faecalis]WBM39999.1 hypothetical protein M2J83_09365 [Alcaligenes faecalis]